jgi:hypothetical protein
LFDRVALLDGVVRDEGIFRGADGEDTRLRWVDLDQPRRRGGYDGGELVDCVVHAKVGDGEGTASVFLRFQSIEVNLDDEGSTFPHGPFCLGL